MFVVYVKEYVCVYKCVRVCACVYRYVCIGVCVAFINVCACMCVVHIANPGIEKFFPGNL